MQKINFVKMDPGGNVTILVTGGLSPETIEDTAARAAIAGELLQERHLQAEQVGFVTTPTTLVMMGGEFCGNAARTLAAWLVFKENLEEWSGEITVSGVSRPLQAKARRLGQARAEAEVEMPCLKEFNSVHNTTWRGKEVTLVQIEGITHILLDEEHHPFPEQWEQEAAELRRAFGLENLPAVGAIWYKEGQIPEIKPVVWVRETDTTYYETACGSGTLAFGLFTAKQSMNGGDFFVRQPAGETLRVSITLESGKRRFKQAFLCGPVRMVAAGDAWLSKGR